MYDPVDLSNFDTSKLPSPVGYKILLAVPEHVKKTAGGIIIPEERTDKETFASPVGLVVAIGPSAFKGNDFDPEETPRFKVGDYVCHRPYAGSTFRIKGVLFRFINDDTVEGVSPDITLLERT